MIKETMTIAMSTDQIASRQTSFLMALSQILPSPNNKHTFRDCVKTNVLSHGVLADPFFSQKQIYLLRIDMNLWHLATTRSCIFVSLQSFTRYFHRQDSCACMHSCGCQFLLLTAKTSNADPLKSVDLKCNISVSCCHCCLWLVSCPVHEGYLLSICCCNI